jgi:hypothetical protein
MLVSYFISANTSFVYSKDITRKIAQLWFYTKTHIMLQGTRPTLAIMQMYICSFNYIIFDCWYSSLLIFNICVLCSSSGVTAWTFIHIPNNQVTTFFWRCHWMEHYAARPSAAPHGLSPTGSGGVACLQSTVIRRFWLWQLLVVAYVVLFLSL